MYSKVCTDSFIVLLNMSWPILLSIDKSLLVLYARLRLLFVLQEQYWAPPDFKRLLTAKLKYLAATGRLIKVVTSYVLQICGVLLIDLDAC